jgi:AAA15 family ATPase/GTPase
VFSDVSVNLAYQGTGIQKALAIVSGVIFSPAGSTIIVEEPEVHLNRGSIEALVDLFNYAVTALKKQIILSTHSLDLLLQYASDVGMGSPRGAPHITIDPMNFKLLGFERTKGTALIKEYSMKERFSTVMQRVRDLLKPESPTQLPPQAA